MPGFLFFQDKNDYKDKEAQMKEYHTLIADIRTEACELADKLKRLEVFMMSDDFCKISPEQKGLLEQQYDLMAKYKVTLVKRAHRINYEHLHNQGKEDAQEPERMEPHVFAAMEYEAHRQKNEAKDTPRSCENCKHFIYAAPYDGKCSIAVPCDKGSQWEAK